MSCFFLSPCFFTSSLILLISSCFSSFQLLSPGFSLLSSSPSRPVPPSQSRPCPVPVLSRTCPACPIPSPVQVSERDGDRHYNHFQTHHHHPPLNFSKPLRAFIEYSLSYTQSCTGLRKGRGQTLLSSSSSRPTVPVPSLSCPTVPVPSLSCPCPIPSPVQVSERDGDRHYNHFQTTTHH